MRTGAIVILAIGMSSQLPAPTAAADLVLLSSNAINAVLAEVVPRFERATKHKVTMRLDYGSLLRKQIEAGATFDVAILVGSLDALVRHGKIAAGTPIALGRSGYGLAVRKGAHKPDIGSTEAFKRTMLNAKSVAYSKDGGSGRYFLRLLNRLGIAEAMKSRLRPGANTQKLVASGEVEMTVNGIVPILRSPGIDLVGPLPPELQSYSTFFAGVSTRTANNDAAMALLRHLASPTSAATFKKRGVEPAS
jgi:molybdate transport system substrate-binding protein